MTNKELVELIKKQLDQQQDQLALQKEQFEHQAKQNQNQLDAILQSIQLLAKPREQSDEPPAERVMAEVQSNYSVPTFAAFDPSTELWSDYHLRFQTFVKAHSVPENKVAQIFLTNQSVATYKLLQNLSSQQQPPVSINDATMEILTGFMAEQFDLKLFVIRERYKF